jgi:hypothetical protein
MSFAKFIGEIAENGITTARAMYGRLDKGATDAQKKRIDAAKAKFKERPKSRSKTQSEGMAQDPIAGDKVKGAVDVQKGKAGKVTQSPEPGFLQQQRSEGSRARAERKVEASQKKRTGKTKAERESAARREEEMEAKDVRDTMSARAKASATARGKKRKEPDDFATAINRKTGEINEAAFNRLTKNQQESLMRDIRARFSTTRAREIMARIDEMEPTKAGESGVRRRSGRASDRIGAAPRSMQGPNARSPKPSPSRRKSGVTGRGGESFNKGGMPRKGSIDYRKGGMVKAIHNNKRGG